MPLVYVSTCAVCSVSKGVQKKRADGRIDKSSLPFSLSLDTDFFINVI